MKNNKILLIILVVVIALIAVFAAAMLTNNSQSVAYVQPQNSNNNANLQDNVLGKESYGSVKISGPFGNPNSNIKIGYVVGLHPLENQAHSAFLNEFYDESDDLDYAYYLYEINVTQDRDDYDNGRMNGQLLAQNYIVPDAIDKNLSLVVDVHSNQGNWDENQFIFSPNQMDVSKDYANQVVRDIGFSTYYIPPNPTSTDYLTLPLIEGGVPAFIYEEFDQNSFELMEDHMDELIEAVDSLRF